MIHDKPIMKIKFLIPVLLICLTGYSHDSTKVKMFNHEIGFNTVSLIKQLVSNNPTSTLPQLPYAVYYNLYYKNTIGIRLGLGLNTQTTETAITGQVDNRITRNRTQDYRVGLSYNFIKGRRFKANVFGDYIRNQTLMSTANTSTVQSFPDPVSTITVESLDKTIGNGAEAGVGLQYNILRHLSVYIEVPLVFMSKQTLTETTINDSGVTDKTSSLINSKNFQIILPTTVYLVLKF